MGKKVAVVQSNYIPWKGYFDLINRVDEFILYDDMQYTRRDWRNRNKIKTPDGLKWLTIPVQVKGKYLQKINETEVADQSWRQTHWNTIVHNYARAPHFADYRDRFEELYLKSDESGLSWINYAFLMLCCQILGITTRLSWSMDYQLADHLDRRDRLVDLCQQAGASVYLSGPSARSYMDDDVFLQQGMKLEYIDYSGYPEYEQLFPPFEHAVSILDLIFITGPEASNFMKSF
jgi:hypothetical protein